MSNDLMTTNTVSTVLDLVEGDVYRFAGIKGPKREDGSQTWKWPPAYYRLLCVDAQHVHTYQSCVVYRCISGRDKGRCFIAGQQDWARNFTRVIEADDEGRRRGNDQHA